jgi:hypothetical protein
MIDHPNLHMRWGNSAEKRRWMRSLAMLLNAMKDSAILKTDREREGYKLVRERLRQEFEYERLDVAAGRLARGARPGARQWLTGAPAEDGPAGARLQQVGFQWPVDRKKPRARWATRPRCGALRLRGKSALYAQACLSSRLERESSRFP